MKNLHKTLLFALILSLIAASMTLYLQLTLEDLIKQKCSYLDPAIIDGLAFLVTLFLIIEGLIRIFEHPNASLKRQLTRTIRIAIGFAILIIHIQHLLHK